MLIGPRQSSGFDSYQQRLANIIAQQQQEREPAIGIGQILDVLPSFASIAGLAIPGIGAVAGPAVGAATGLAKGGMNVANKLMNAPGQQEGIGNNPLTLTRNKRLFGW